MIFSHLGDVGTYGHAFAGFLNCNLALCFGPSTSPGAWESYSAAILTCSRLLQPENRHFFENERFVDDFWTVCALLCGQARG
jgi:hypothetical protein